MISTAELADPIYGSQILLLHGSHADVEAYGKKGQFHSQVAQAILEEADNTIGRFFIVEKGATKERIMVAYVHPGSDHKEATASHEALHLTFEVMRFHGMTLSRESEEAFTYYHSFVVKHFLRLLTKKKRRTRRRKGK